ncbi:MAG: hypothetical protein KGL39_41565 [Patescibacteria group bacterium]|nr:hypothetical protein [Patescibacteria group bacterium]
MNRTLDRNRVATYVQNVPLREVRPHPTRFEFSPQRGWKWAQRLCFWILAKIGARASEEVIVWRRIGTQNDALLESLLKQEHWLLENLYYRRQAYRLLIGPEQEMELLRIAENIGMRHFSLDAGIRTADRNGPRWHDIPITVIPWMKGALIVPRESEC